MKTMMFCAAVGFLFAVSTASTCHAAMGEPTAPERVYCAQYAASEYDAAVARGDEFPDASFEGAAEECEVQWLMVTASTNGFIAADIELSDWTAGVVTPSELVVQLEEAAKCLETDCQPLPGEEKGAR